MTPRQLGIGLLCIGTLNALIGILLLSADSDASPLLAGGMVISAAVLMGVGVVVGRRTDWR